MDYIKFNELRDFGQVVNATFAFISQEFKALLKPIIFFAGPFLLLGVLIYGLGQYGVMQTEETTKYGNKFSDMIPQIIYSIVGGLFLFVGLVMLVTSVNSYIKIYNEKGKDNFNIDDVWTETKSKFMKIAISHFLLSIAFVIIGVLGIIFLEIPFIYVLVVTVFVFSIQSHENKGFIEAIRRSIFLINDRWFMTFLLLLISTLVVSFISYALVIPGAIIAGITQNYTASGDISPSLVNVIVIVFSSIITLFYYFLFAIIHVLINFQYFNMVEQKEYPSLRAEIKLINQNE